MWCPSVSLSTWANAWLAGKASPDDVLDALSLWAPRQSVAAYDGVAAGRTGLPWPDVDDAGTVSLLQTLRGAAGRSPGISEVLGAPGRPEPSMVTINLVLPVPGDVRGLPANTQFARDALAAGEGVIIANPTDPGSAIGLVPEHSYGDPEEHDDEATASESCGLTWMVYSIPDTPVFEHHDLGDAEMALRSAVRSAADVLGAMQPGAGLNSRNRCFVDPRGMVEQLLDSARQHRIPDHAPARAERVLQTAAHVDAIIAVGTGLSPIPEAAPGRVGRRLTGALETAGAQSSSEVQSAANALRPLTSVVRSARMAAVSLILHSAWTD
ncbi:hypothetical protein [Mycobacterium sp.]|uniref:hypothetical protein n=1 Tax=Mycobacterium sp. TaxID=1785 RepID=UPI003A8C451A